MLPRSRGWRYPHKCVDDVTLPWFPGATICRDHDVRRRTLALYNRQVQLIRAQTKES